MTDEILGSGVLPALAPKPYCCQPGCPNPAERVEIVTGIGKDLHTGQPIRRVRCLCLWHGRGYMTLDEYKQQRAAERVRATLLAGPPEPKTWNGYRLDWESQALEYDPVASALRVVDSKKTGR